LVSPLKAKKTWAKNSLIGYSTKFFDKVNIIMTNRNSNLNVFTTFKKLTIQSDIKFEVIRSYERNEKEINLITCKSNNFGTPKLISSKKSSFKNFSQFRFLGKNEEEEQNFEKDRERENNSITAKTLNVLLIDDEQSIRAFSKNSLKKISESENIKFNIEEADDGISGLTMILYKFLRDQETYDLVIADDTMNFLDGSQLFKLLGLLIDREFFKRKLPENIVNKFLICSSDSDNVKNKIDLERENIENNNDNNKHNFKRTSCYLLNNLEICEKPLKIKILKQFC
jgi:hypothetical protein